jgi:hypothetical protein
MSMAEPQRFKGGAETVGAADEEQQLVVTINPAMGGIVRVERVDKAGKRQELAEEEWAKLVSEDEVEEIETGLEEAFEAGIAVVLGDAYDEDEASEDNQERALRRLLIGRLLRRPVRRRILQRILVSRLLHRASSKTGASSKAKAIAQKGA